MVLRRDRREVAALLCGNPADIEIREGESPLDFTLCVRRAGRVEELPRQQLLLFTPFQPEENSPYGVSLLRSYAFSDRDPAEDLSGHRDELGADGNVRFAVVCKPGNDSLERAWAQERGEQIAREWSAAMQAGKNGTSGFLWRWVTWTSRSSARTTRSWTVRCRYGRSWKAGGPDRHSALFAGTELVLYRTDEYPAGGYADQ